MEPRLYQPKEEIVEKLENYSLTRKLAAFELNTNLKI
jgi:hypothetical protein